MRRQEAGTASVELAASIPILVVLFLLMVQVGSVLLDQIAVTQAAREAARAAAVDPSPGAAAVAARAATRLDPASLAVSEGGRLSADGLIHVAVRYRTQILFPFSQRVLFRPELTAEAAMKVEVP